MQIGKILRIDLSSEAWIQEGIDPQVIEQFIGGLGLSSKILFEETGPNVEPMGTENIIIISPGLLNGTGAPTAYRTEITTKSPLTRIIGTGSFGGLFGSNLRKAGFESIIIKGKSSYPVYLKIDNHHVELKDARHLWGKDTWETTEIIKKKEGEDFCVMAIGQAGENLVRFACPVVDYYHAAGRSTAGCVLGNKKLKAVAVRGTGRIHVVLPEVFEKVSNEIKVRIKSYPEKGLRLKIGSTYVIAEAAERGSLGGMNYQVGVLPKSNDLWRPEDFTKHLVKGPPFCGDCLLSKFYGCDATLVAKKGKFKGTYLRGAGFSHPVWNWGVKCGIESFPAMVKFKEVCDRFGMDQMGPIPFALELFQRGIITKEDLDGNELKWGDEEAILDMLSKIAHRIGFGNILAEGSAEASKIIGRGAEKYALNIKGMEILSGADPRGAGMSTNLGYATCVRGGDDVKNTHVIIEGVPDWVKKQAMKVDDYAKWFLNSLDMFEDYKNKIYGNPPNLNASIRSPDGIVFMTIWYEDMAPIRDSLGICLFAVNTTSVIGINHCTKLLSACLGSNLNPTEVIKIGERIINLIKAYNVREGQTKLDDNLPARFFCEPLKTGSSKDIILSKDYMNKLRELYYDLRGWDRETGNPLRKKLEELGLEFTVDELAKGGLI
jgi:aldehyde:ferredoxin oxidoreductase